MTENPFREGAFYWVRAGGVLPEPARFAFTDAEGAPLFDLFDESVVLRVDWVGPEIIPPEEVDARVATGADLDSLVQEHGEGRHPFEPDADLRARVFPDLRARSWRW